MYGRESAEGDWIVKNRDACHDLLSALNDPADGEPRVDKGKCENMPPKQYQLDYDGFTDLHTLQTVRSEPRPVDPG